MKKLNIIVGHSAYSGRNAPKYHTNKTAAIVDLISRGFTRKVARETLEDVLSKPAGYKTLTHKPSYDLVEVYNCPIQM